MTETTQATENRLGWSRSEDALLFEAVRAARAKAEPLKSVFERVAAETGRRPNSIRNYYYVRIKQADAPETAAAHSPAFVPFTEEEIDHLLRTVLGAQARGQSVRACTLEMGNGDNRMMLRYQNKYRALIKNNPDRVREVIAAMRAENAPTFDPYEERPRHRSGRPRGSGRRAEQNLLSVVGSVVNDLDRVEGLDVGAFFESLGALAVSAARGAAAAEQLSAEGGSISLLEENRELNAELQSQQRELAAQRERFTTLLGYFRQLVQVNSEFLGLTSVVKVSNLSNYIRDLSEKLEGCEQWMSEN